MTDVLLFHHAQGLTQGVRHFAHELRRAGHRVVVPDLYEGRTFATLEAGLAYADEVGIETIVERGVRAAEGLPADCVYAGFSLGVLPAQKLAQTRPGARGALLFSACVPVSSFGSWPARLPVQIHAMEHDHLFAEEGDLEAARELTATVPHAELFLYPGDRHLFADCSLPDYEASAAGLLRSRVLSFLAMHARTESAPDAGEREMLEGFLDFQRATMLAKTEGLDREQLASRLPTSALSLGGLLYHLALVEESWMEEHFLGRSLREPWIGVDWDQDPDWEFRTAADLEPEELRRRYREACDRSREAAAAAASLDQRAAAAAPEGRRPVTLRWILHHLIEETARHVGHADLLREAIDGSVGE